jgi:hypothetical protein
MEQWEYTSQVVEMNSPFVATDDYLAQFITNLNQWGEQGWQLVQVVAPRQGVGNYVAIFKRRKPQ